MKLSFIGLLVILGLLPILMAPGVQQVINTAAPVAGGGSAPVVVAHIPCNATNTTVTCTLGGNVTAAHMILGIVAIDSSFDTINTPTMTGETFTQWTDIAGAVNGSELKVYAVNSAAGGHAAVVFTTAGTRTIHAVAVEISGQAGSPRNAQGTTESATLSVSTSGATTVAKSLAFGIFMDGAGNPGLTITSPYAVLDDTNFNFTEMITGTKTLSSTGVQTATGGGNGTDNCIQTIVVVAGT